MGFENRMGVPQDPALVAGCWRERLLATCHRGSIITLEDIRRLQQTGGSAVRDFPIARGIQLQLPSEVVVAAGEVFFVDLAHDRAEWRAREAVDDVLGVPLAGRAGPEAFRVGQRPLELPVCAVLGLTRGLWRR